MQKKNKNKADWAVDKALVDGKQLTYAEELLVDAVREGLPVAGRVLVAGNRSGVVVAEALRAWPQATVVAHAFDAHHARAIRDHLTTCGLPTDNVVCAPQVGTGYARALFMTTPRSMPAELVLDQLQDIYLSLDEGGSLLAAFEGDPDEALKTMRLVWSAIHVVRRAKHAVLFRATRTEALRKVRVFASDWPASVPGGPQLTFTSLPGCFCHRRADEGGLALAEVAAKDVEARAVAGEATLRLLDMGCGCGLVGLLVADAWRRARAATPCALTLIDSHARALAAARLNAERAGLAAEFILADDGLPRGRVGDFDLFVGNPPYYSDYRIAEIFLETAYRALRPGGTCLTVVKTASGLQALQEKYFRTVEVLHRRSYCVLKSIRA